jgi:hypothetical protein
MKIFTAPVVVRMAIAALIAVSLGLCSVEWMAGKPKKPPTISHLHIKTDTGQYG